MIRVAAIADIHFSREARGRLRDHWSAVHEIADVLLVAGDLTTHGAVEEAEALADELEVVQVPRVAVLGNHDYHGDEAGEVRRVLERRGVVVLEGESATFTVRSQTLGIAGTKGFGGGFAGACGTAFGEREMKAFVRHGEELATRLEQALSMLRTDVRIALLHYAPTRHTLEGERLELYPFLGSYLLGMAVDGGGADMAIHGHAHMGTEKGVTPGGVPVRNVALPVLRHPYAIYHLEAKPRVTGETAEQLPPEELSVLAG